MHNEDLFKEQRLKANFQGLSQRANYTDRETASCRRS
jgi:hypothetical protein